MFYGHICAKYSWHSRTSDNRGGKYRHPVVCESRYCLYRVKHLLRPKQTVLVTTCYSVHMCFESFFNTGSNHVESWSLPSSWQVPFLLMYFWGWSVIWKGAFTWSPSGRNSSPSNGRSQWSFESFVVSHNEKSLASDDNSFFRYIESLHFSNGVVSA